MWPWNNCQGFTGWCRTSSQLGTHSALGQKQIFASQKALSALPPKRAFAHFVRCPQVKVSVAIETPAAHGRRQRQLRGHAREDVGRALNPRALLCRCTDGHRTNRRAGVPLRTQREDHRAGHPNFVVGERPKVGVLDLIDSRLR
jgi:hypothetical protein